MQVQYRSYHKKFKGKTPSRLGRYPVTYTGQVEHEAAHGVLVVRVTKVKCRGVEIDTDFTHQVNKSRVIKV